jgi:hypothetical protein
VQLVEKLDLDLKFGRHTANNMKKSVPSGVPHVRNLDTTEGLVRSYPNKL